MREKEASHQTVEEVSIMLKVQMVNVQDRVIINDLSNILPGQDMTKRKSIWKVTSASSTTKIKGFI
jgi:hypothetical protein